MNPKILEVLEEDFKINEDKEKDKYITNRDNCELYSYSLKLLHFIKQRLFNEQQSFTLCDKLKIPPLNCLLSIRLENFGNGGKRVYFGIYSHETPFIVSNYFDKIILSIGDILHFEWTRNCDNLETDCLEIVVPQELEFPAKMSVTMYPDFPVTYYNVPETLFPIVQEKFATLSTITKAISKYASEENLIENNILRCQKLLNLGIGVSELPLNQVVLHIKSMLIPMQPLNINVILSEEKTVYNYNLTLPDFRPIPQITEDSFNIPDFDTEAINFGAQKELSELLSSINRNPIEALEAEICGHSSFCELSDESNDLGPRVSISSMNPARRSSVYYWQQWTSEHAPRFLEENKQIHARYPSKK